MPIDEAVNLEQDEYFWHQIIGLEVRTESGESLGKVTDILRTVRTTSTSFRGRAARYWFRRSRTWS